MAEVGIGFSGDIGPKITDVSDGAMPIGAVSDRELEACLG